MSRTIPTLLLLGNIVLIAGCGRSAAERMLDDLNTVNKELTDSMLASPDVLDSKYEHLRMMACAEGRTWADSVNLLYEHASERLYALDELLTGPDVGDGRKPETAFAPDGIGEEALRSSLATYALMENVTPDDSARSTIVLLAQPLRTASDAAAWYQRDFRQAPAPAITFSIERLVTEMAKAKRLCTAALLDPCQPGN